MRCDDRRIWSEAGEGPLDPALAAHVETCPACRARLARYRKLVDLARDGSGLYPPPVPAFEDVRRQVAGGRDGRRLLPRWEWAAGLALAGAVAAAVVAWLPPPVAPEAPGTPPPAAVAPVTGPLLADAPGVTLDGRPVSSAGGFVAVRPGQTVQTARAVARIVDRRVASLALDPDTRLVVQEWNDTTVHLRLEEGRVACDVQHRTAEQQFEVRTDRGTVRVVGTRFSVTSRPDRELIVEVAEGRVAILDPDGTGLASVGTGESWHAGPDRPEPAAAAVAEATPRKIEPPQASPVPTREPPPPAPVPIDGLREMLSAGRTADAVAEIHRALAAATPGKRPRLLALLGDAQRLAGQPELARQAYESALVEGGAAAPEGVHPDLADLLERDLGRPDEAARCWSRYLESHPSGRYASRALWALATAASGRAGREDPDPILRRIVTSFPQAPEAAAAFVKVGRDLVDRGDLAGAEAWFQGRLEAPSRPLREAALVGLMTTAFRRQDRERLESLGTRYSREFPAGTRQDEVKRLMDGMGTR